jgi:hypothetical protein
MSTKESQNKKYICQFCPGKGSNSVYGWRQHISSVKHLENITEAKRTVEEIERQKLIAIQKTSKPKFPCDICLQEFASKYSLERHTNVCKKRPQFMAHTNDSQNGDMTIIVNKTDINETTDNIKLVINHHVYDYLMQRINNVLQYHVFNNHWGNNLHILPLGLETDNHFTVRDTHIIHLCGKESIRKYIELLYSNKLNHNIYRTNISQKEYKFVCANGQIKHMKWEQISANLASNMVTMFSNFLDNPNIKIQEQYKKELQYVRDLLADMTDVLFDKFLTITQTYIIYYSEAAKINVGQYKKNNQERIGSCVPNIIIPALETWTEFKKSYLNLIYFFNKL